MKYALVIVDMQNAFFGEEPLRSDLARLVTSCNTLIANVREHNIPVYLIRTEHMRDKTTWTRNMLDDNQGFAFPDTDDAQFLDGLDTVGAIEIIKTRDSAFWQTDLLISLQQQSIETIILAGVSTHLCITNTAIDAYSANLRVVLASDAIASNKPELHDTFIKFLRDEYRMGQVRNSDLPLNS